MPQISPDKKPQNVIKGQFTGKGRADWAVLCSLNHVSTIYIFRNASEREPLELAPQSDAKSLQDHGGAAIEYFEPSRPWVANTFLSITTLTVGPNLQPSITKELMMLLGGKHRLCVTSMQVNGCS
jgi:hypothetical protein